MRGRFGTRVDRDAAARLHELAEGWPLGLQLALSVMAAGGDPQAEISVPSTQAGVLHDRFVNLLLANLDAADVAFLTRISILDLLHAELCGSVAQVGDAGERLARLARDTPVFAAGEASDWLRMHALARDELRRRFALLPADEQAALHARAADGLAAQGLFEAAALHALEAGRREVAYDLAERSLYESLMTRGGQGAVLEWLERMPAEEVDRRPRLLLAAAWSLALSERHDEASLFLERILARPGVDAALRCECALIQSGAAVYADDLDRFAALHDPWAHDPPLSDPMLLQVHANRSAFRTLLDGEPALARLRQQQAPRGGRGEAQGYLGRWGDFIVGLSYLWEGQVLLAEKLLRPTLARAEVDLGRRSPFACVIAALLAAATLGAQRPRRPATCSPTASTCWNAARSPKPCCSATGRWRASPAPRAPRTGRSSCWARWTRSASPAACRAFASPAWASRCACMRAGSGPRPAATCARRSTRRLAAPDAPQGPLWRRNVALLREVAFAHAAIAAQDWRRAADILARADDLAQDVKLGRLHIELLGLRAWVLDRCGEKSLPLLREAVDVAAAYGLLRVFDDAHPALGDWVRQALPDGAAPAPFGARPARRADRLARVPAPPRSTPSMVLTPKEREVLELLARHLSNKEIGLTMQVGEETIKWHMKNLFAKLDAGTRKQVVQRARILGLLEAEP